MEPEVFVMTGCATYMRVIDMLVSQDFGHCSDIKLLRRAPFLFVDASMKANSGFSCIGHRIHAAVDGWIALYL